jgi:hypothetical protein
VADGLPSVISLEEIGATYRFDFTIWFLRPLNEDGPLGP